MKIEKESNKIMVAYFNISAIPIPTCTCKYKMVAYLNMKVLLFPSENSLPKKSIILFHAVSCFTILLNLFAKPLQLNTLNTS